MYPQYACKEFNTAMSKLDFRVDEVPQLQDISESLKAATGWQVGVCVYGGEGQVGVLTQ
jgi:phenylalanine-4-hydroxylase